MINESKKRDPRNWKRWKNSGAVGFLPFDQNKHPEILPDEVFLSNMDEVGFFLTNWWKTKRKGSVAINKFGQSPVTLLKWYFPVFVKKSESKKKGFLIQNNRKSVRLS